MAVRVSDSHYGEQLEIWIREDLLPDPREEETFPPLHELVEVWEAWPYRRPLTPREAQEILVRAREILAQAGYHLIYPSPTRQGEGEEGVSPDD